MGEVQSTLPHQLCLGDRDGSVLTDTDVRLGREFNLGRNRNRTYSRPIIFDSPIITSPIVTDTTLYRTEYGGRYRSTPGGVFDFRNLSESRLRENGANSAYNY